MSQIIPITVAYGDGIGPEIMKAVLGILEAAGAQIKPEVIEVGEPVYLKGFTSGISDNDWTTIKKNRIFLKAPITTPQGKGYKSLNVSIRKALGLYQNVRPVRSYAPFVKSHFEKINCIIYRENEEDLYAGIEHRHTNDTFIATKLITRQGSEKIIKAAFEYARSAGRKRVTCMTKDNIMKMCDGLFHSIFQDYAAEYAKYGIESDHMIIDIGSAKLASHPENFDVVVTLNLYGDIISDIVADVAGSVGLAGSANIGSTYAMFEAIHGSAPTMAGHNKANPSGLLNGAIMMLAHIGQGSIATKIENALFYTIENGIGTKDIYLEGRSKQLVGTQEFAAAVIANLGKTPAVFKSNKYADFDFDNSINTQNIDPAKVYTYSSASKKILGVDFFINKIGTSSTFGKEVQDVLNNSKIDANLQSISVKGLPVFPKSQAGEVVSDFWACRFLFNNTSSYDQISQLSLALTKARLDITRSDTLYEFDGVRGYTLGQSE